MGLKFRRGTTAQKSGSLAFGEPYVNTDLNTLQIGGATGDILLAAAGTSSVFVGQSVSASSWVSASSLNVTGNANVGGDLTIGGKITIGDNSSDTVNVVASLSSSLIPSADNTFDLGDVNHVWKDLYISKNSIKFVDAGAVVSTLNSTSLTSISSSAITFSQMLTHGIPTMDGSSTNNFTGSQFISGNINITGSIIPGASNLYDLGSETKIFRDLYISTGSIKIVNPGTGVVVGTLSSNASGDFNTAGAISSSTITGLGNATLYSSSVASRLVIVEAVSASVKAVTDTFATSASVASATATSISTLSGSVKAVTDTFATSASVASATATSISTLSGSVATNLGQAVNPTSDVTFRTITANEFHITTISSSVLFTSGSTKFGDTSDDIMSVTGSLNITGSINVIGAISSSTITGFGNVTTHSSSVATRLNTIETAGYAVSSSVASATATSITSLSSSVKAVTDTFATSASVASATATSISTISGSVKTVTDALSGRVTTLEGKDISITLTGDVTGTGTITDLANVSFATTIAADSVALGTDTTGNYVATMTAGTGITVGTATGEGSTPVITNTGVTSNVAGTGVSVSGATGAVTIAIGQAVATTDNVRFNSVGVGMAASATAGRIDAAGDVVAYSSSDKNFKENITPIENPIEKIRKISGNTYDWKADLKDVHGYEGNDVGVIAQEIEEVLPQIVTTRENGYKAVKYEKLVALLIEGIKEQQTQIEKLRMDLDNYECKCDNCKSK